MLRVSASSRGKARSWGSSAIKRLRRLRRSKPLSWGWAESRNQDRWEPCSWTLWCHRVIAQGSGDPSLPSALLPAFLLAGTCWAPLPRLLGADMYVALLAWVQGTGSLPNECRASLQETRGSFWGVSVALLSNWNSSEEKDSMTGLPKSARATLSPQPSPHRLPCVLLTSQAAIFLPAEARTRSSFMAGAQGTLCRLEVGPEPMGDQLVGRNSRTTVSSSRGHSSTCEGQEEKGCGRLRGKARPSEALCPVLPPVSHPCG